MVVLEANEEAARNAKKMTTPKVLRSVVEAIPNAAKWALSKLWISKTLGLSATGQHLPLYHKLWEHCSDSLLATRQTALWSSATVYAQGNLIVQDDVVQQ